ncbi:arylamine N-acetyltransferase family protein [Mycolicibacterium diernhoferi]|uniref:Arylamine N-acetyltransferase n=1 Tax=Mycolicibacterium diernhoferi TaxID=1801 RepID=A0A1Q4HHB4_9MYCO|nr:arylamine N-acetyltransferase [Mycolicibacterium diernhoferi]OJZ66938.1 arylamine N-acetyltransferase [Mycolicibacterium diernhoferi]OPE55640.1 arylamine N-acetyltransferase [Mycolicibacterium diernhoferi]PEG52408.1 arylamine N-acetyltransferase [Mycolicibacterium diernhoferi]QYL23127.1 arylamine N-acetyltransferase [Mycolicibacterium diernhoferi]
MNPDTAGYLARIGYPESAQVKPTLDTLHALHAAHNRSIPFENLDPVLGTPVADLGAPALTDKLVGRRRGGYCYEQNGLFGYVLEDLGYRVDRLAGRVIWMSGLDALPPEWDAPIPALTHNVLAVTVPGERDRFLADVGFGGQTLSSPIRLQAGPVQQTRHEPYRLVDAGPGALRLEAKIRGAWQPLYVFGTAPQRCTDLEVGSWYVSTHPESIFVVGLSVALVTDEARWNLRGRDLAVHADGGTERIRLASAAEVLDQLTGRFGIDLTGLGDVEAAVSRVLDA